MGSPAGGEAWLGWPRRGTTERRAMTSRCRRAGGGEDRKVHDAGGQRDRYDAAPGKAHSGGGAAEEAAWLEDWQRRGAGDVGWPEVVAGQSGRGGDDGGAVRWACKFAVSSIQTLVLFWWRLAAIRWPCWRVSAGRGDLSFSITLPFPIQ